MIENPPSFVVRTELQKAAFDNGFRVALPPPSSDSGWLGFRSTTARGVVWLGAGSKTGPWLLVVEAGPVAQELGVAPSQTTTAEVPGGTLFPFATLAELHDALGRAYRLGVSLPDVPLREFLASTREMPRTTETERLAVERVGQNVFREALLRYWNGRCPVTGITDPALLRASHIVPWAECESDALRLDVHNGLLLSALWDAAFDAGLVSFDDEGAALASGGLSAAAAERLRVGSAEPLRLTPAHRANLALHRAKHGFPG